MRSSHSLVDFSFAPMNARMDVALGSPSSNSSSFSTVEASVLRLGDGGRIELDSSSQHSSLCVLRLVCCGL